MNSQIRDTNRTPNHLKAKISSPRYIVLKPSKINVKKFGKKDCNLQKEPHYVIIRFFFFSPETLPARREWNEIFKILKE